MRYLERGSFDIFLLRKKETNGRPGRGRAVERVISEPRCLDPFPSSAWFSSEAREVGQQDTKKRRRGTWQLCRERGG